MIRKSILVENQEIKDLLSVIKQHYVSDNKNTIQEVSLNHVVNNVYKQDIKNYIREWWYALETKVGHQVTLLENNYKKSIINKLYKKFRDLNFVIKTRPDDLSKELHDSIKKASNIDIVIKEFSFFIKK
ncbi:normocyte binding protein 2b [Francisella endosymbiont of Amblyomma maculatum]|nr:normocyte binding protein 2b [Francisella endosymbiont of Amblyomma maculatum]